MNKRRRTRHRHPGNGAWVYAERGADGRFKNIYTYRKSMRADLKARSKAERARKARNGRKHR